MVHTFCYFKFPKTGIEINYPAKLQILHFFRFYKHNDLTCTRNMDHEMFDVCDSVHCFYRRFLN